MSEQDASDFAPDSGLGAGEGREGVSSPGRGVCGALSEEVEGVGDFAHSGMGVPERAEETGWGRDSGVWDRERTAWEQTVRMQSDPRS